MKYKKLLDDYKDFVVFRADSDDENSEDVTLGMIFDLVSEVTPDVYIRNKIPVLTDRQSVDICNICQKIAANCEDNGVPDFGRYENSNIVHTIFNMNDDEFAELLEAVRNIKYDNVLSTLWFRLISCNKFTIDCDYFDVIASMLRSIIYNGRYDFFYEKFRKVLTALDNAGYEYLDADVESILVIILFSGNHEDIPEVHSGDKSMGLFICMFDALINITRVYDKDIIRKFFKNINDVISL